VSCTFPLYILTHQFRPFPRKKGYKRVVTKFIHGYFPSSLALTLSKLYSKNMATVCHFQRYKTCPHTPFIVCSQNKQRLFAYKTLTLVTEMQYDHCENGN
jgi:hypothetical protein